jgi:threonine synthase
VAAVTADPAARSRQGARDLLVDVTRLVGQLAGGAQPAGLRVLALDETRRGEVCHKQRAADAAVAAAAHDGYQQVTAGSCGNYGLAVARAAEAAQLAATVVVPASFTADTSAISQTGARVLRIGTTYEDAVTASHRLATTSQAMADLNVDGPYGGVVASAHAAIADELACLPGGPPVMAWIPVGNGTTLTAVATALRGHGCRSRPVGVTSRGNNSILGSWPHRTHRQLDPASLVPTPANEPLVNADALHGQDALDVLHATGGHVTGLDDRALEEAALLLHQAGLPVTPAGAAGVAGLAAAARDDLPRGVHVAILTG